MARLKSRLIALHHNLVPQELNLGVLPYLWLPYLGMFYIFFAFYDPPQWHYWAAAAATLGFLPLYFRAFWVHGLNVLPYIAIMMGMGMLLSFVNYGSAVFFVYAAAFANQIGSVRRGLALLGGILALISLFCWQMHMPYEFIIPGLAFTALIGLVNVYQKEMAEKNALLKLSQEEISRLATSAERERIARDLHDVIGHTLSMITMKAQLADKLVERDPVKARSEVQELEKISRQALSDVREAVSGYRQKDLKSELSNARTMLDSADIALNSHISEIALPDAVDATLGFVVREAVTNLVRHSQATTCELAIEARRENVTLEIADNGHCSDVTEGNGLRGMRERIAQLGGHIRFDSNNGFRINIEVPL